MPLVVRVDGEVEAGVADQPPARCLVVAGGAAAHRTGQERVRTHLHRRTPLVEDHQVVPRPSDQRLVARRAAPEGVDEAVAGVAVAATRTLAVEVAVAVAGVP